MKYSEKLKDPRWQKKRLEIFERDGFRCKQCGDGDSTLCIHHIRYIHGRDPWDYPEHLLITLCEYCHDEEYEFLNNTVDLLIEQIKDRGFLSGSIGALAAAFNGLVMLYPPDVMASIIKWSFRDKSTMDEIASRYFFAKEK